MDNHVSTILSCLEHAKVGEEIKLVMQRLCVASDTVRWQYKLEEPSIRLGTPGSRRVMFLDTETTGTDTERDEVVELGYVVVEFDDYGKLGDIVAMREMFNQPELPIPAGAQAIHGISNEMVAGHKLDVDVILEDLGQCALVIAHNSGFDRRMMERYVPKFKEVPWGCTFADIQWREKGFSSSKLEFLAYMCGFFYDAHRAVNDVYAMIEICRLQNLFVDILKSVLTPQYILSAMGSPFGKKDDLKAKGYKPLYVGGKFISWYTSVAEELVEVEKNWLLKDAGCSHVPVKKITALERYSDREKL